QGQAPPATIRGHRLWRRPSPAELPLSPLASRHLSLSQPLRRRSPPSPPVAAAAATLACRHAHHRRPSSLLKTTKPPPPSNLQICRAFDFRHSTMVEHGEVEYNEVEQAGEFVRVW
ncbi:hypothetical protein Dimus_033401, partial [Dionaea muscipula]